jgi:hypothetical protein
VRAAYGVLEVVMSSLLARTAAAAALLAVLATLVSGPALADTPDQAGGTTAVWTPKTLRFTYMGFTSRYSCDGLRDKIRSTLLKFGARSDLNVRSTACADLGRPTPFPGVTININVLVPADAKSAQAKTSTVPAHWQLVDLGASRDPLDVAGDCELIEQIKQRILGLFSTRNIDYHSTCIPNQLELGGTQLKAQFLVADAPDAKGANQ